MRQWINKIVNNGTSYYSDSNDKLRVRHFNALTLFGLFFIIPVIFLINIIEKDFLEIIYVSVCALFVLISFFFNTRGRNQLAVLVVVMSVIITSYVVLFSVHTQTSAPYMNLVTAFVALHLIRKTYIKYVFIVISILSFFVTNAYQIIHYDYSRLDYIPLLFILITIIVGIIFSNEDLLRNQRFIKKQEKQIFDLELSKQKEKLENLMGDYDNLNVILNYQNKFLKDVLSKVKQLNLSEDAKSSKVKEVLFSLRNQISINEKSLLNINNESQQRFLEMLLKKHPNLSRTDIDLCVFIKMNLSNKEIAALKNTSDNAINVAKNRLRKKLDVNTNGDIFSYLISLKG